MIPSATIQSSKPRITRDIGRAMMWPSRHAWTISTPIMREPSRSKSKPCTRSAPIACSMVQVITHWAEMSTNCASPVRSIRAWATKAHAAASAPVCRQTCGTLIRTGARSRGPCSDMGPPRAANTRSLATSPARGPSLPKGEICTCTMRGLSSRTSAGGDAKRLQHARRRRLEQEVRRSDQRLEHVAVRRRTVHIEHDGALVAIEGAKRKAGETVRAARPVLSQGLDLAPRGAAGRLHPNHIGTKVAEQHGAKLPPLIREVQHPIRLKHSPSSPFGLRHVPQATPFSAKATTFAHPAFCLPYAPTGASFPYRK